MEFIEGQTLKDRTSSRPLKLHEAIDIAIQVLEGLREAHERGIVHRDINSANVMVTSRGQVKIMDFGLAKQAGLTGITKLGTSVGTIAYMSPEQARGEAVDQRTDIWSLGVVLYEMISGQLPFAGEFDQVVIYSILNQEARPIISHDELVPAGVKEIVRRAMAKSPDDRYQCAADMLADLKLFRGKPEFAALKEGPALGAGQRSIAVLPFANLSADKEQEYFCDGMAEEIINALTNVEGLRVVARTSAFMFKDKHEDTREIGRKLNVETLLEGSVRKAGNRLRITAQLINVGDGYHLWSERFDRELADVFAIQDEISLAIVGKLKVGLLGDEEKKIVKRYTQDLEAYDLYLKGRYHWNRRTPDALRKAIGHFEQVIQKDPEFALAYAGLADCYSMLAQVRVVPPKEVFPKAKALANKALEIDETLAEAHTSLAFVLSCFDWDWTGAEREFRRAIELNPNYATAYQWFAMTLLNLGRTSEAIKEINKALELDPLSLINNTAAGVVYAHTGRQDKAVEQAEKILDMDPTFGFAHEILAYVNERRGKYDEAVEGRLKAYSFAGFLSQQEIAALRETYASSGWNGFLRGWLKIVHRKAEQGQVLYYGMASLYARLDDTEKAIECLEKAYQEHDFSLGGVLMDDEFEKLRSDPRFVRLIKKMGFPQ
jgi:TolB-like protein/Tfp pilus assembly protein PilF